MFRAYLRDNLMIMGLSLVIVCLFVPVARAQTLDRTTKMTINQPFEVLGKTLPAGTYMFRLESASRKIVRITNADATQTYAIVFAKTDYRTETPQHAEFTFDEAPAGTPLPLRSWFYPGYKDGLAFASPNGKEVETTKPTGE